MSPYTKDLFAQSQEGAMQLCLTPFSGDGKHYQDPEKSPICATQTLLTLFLFLCVLCNEDIQNGKPVAE